MELLCPSGFGIHHCKIVETGAAEFLQFALRRSLAEEDHLEDGFNLDLLVVSGIEGLETMVGEFASHRFEEPVTLPQSLDQV